MKSNIYMLLLIPVLILLNSCHTINSRDSSAEPVHIHRFDKDLFELITLDTPELREKMIAGYPGMLKVIDGSILLTEDSQNRGFFEWLINYYSEPTLNQLYRDALTRFDDIETIETNLGAGFQYLKKEFPSMQIPAVYMHVSGLQQNLLVDDSLLSISIDKYLGADYPLYQGHFYDYQLRKMTPDHIVPDYLKAWLLSEYPFRGNDRVLLERMIHEGKIRYIIHRALPKVLPEVLMGYSSAEYQWGKRNEKNLWTIIIERKHLYTPDAATTAAYFSDRPSTFIADEAPGDLGSWMGWQIVTKYMDKTRNTIEGLMRNTDYQDILTKSRYKP